MARRRWTLAAASLGAMAAFGAVLAWQRRGQPQLPSGAAEQAAAEPLRAPAARPRASSSPDHPAPRTTPEPRSLLHRLGYDAARQLLVVVGLLVLLLTAALAYARRVETVEVVATLLFIPVFVAAVFWKLRGGVVAGVATALVYLWMRSPAIDAVGGGRFTGLILSRSVALIGFGALAGWAIGQLESSLVKLELYDEVDDATGLFNARFLLQDLELESARAERYRTIFSVAVVEVPAPALAALPRRARTAAVRDLGRLIRDSARTVDRAVHAQDESRHLFAVVLPETATDGAQVFGGRLADAVRHQLAIRGAAVDGALPWRATSHPGDAEGLDWLRATFSAIDRVEHPEHVAG